nr:MAG TPA: hypothetical protein [Bacteriophage sp.]
MYDVAAGASWQPFLFPGNGATNVMTHSKTK